MGEEMIRCIAPALRHPTNRGLAEFHRYWGENHGPLYAQTTALRRYVQHLTLEEAYGGDPAPSFDGASMFWFDDLEPMVEPETDPDAAALNRAVMEDDAQLFDRLPGWPLAHKRAAVIGTERVVLEGDTTPEMVKGIFIMARRPGLSLEEFSEHWFDVHGPLVAKLPEIRRYVQTHGLPETYARVKGIMAPTHDGFCELWFDDFDSLVHALHSPEWETVQEDAETLFAQPVAFVAGRERVQKG
jgi:uncharacterized protein (TIGR02118 family)